MKKIIFVLVMLLCLTSFARADHIAIAAGPSLNGTTNPKAASLGYEYELSNLAFLGQCSAVFDESFLGVCSVVISIKVQTPAGVFTRVGVGPALITHTTDRLGSIPEANIRYALGFDQGGYEIGFEGSHVSNASLFSGPNLGMDHGGFYVGIKI